MVSHICCLHIAMCLRVLRDALVSQVAVAILQARGLWLEQFVVHFFPLYPRRAMSVVLNIANLILVLTCLTTSQYLSFLFLVMRSATLFANCLHSLDMPLYVQHSLQVLILLLLLLLLVLFVYVIMASAPHIPKL